MNLDPENDEESIPYFYAIGMAIFAIIIVWGELTGGVTIDVNLPILGDTFIDHNEVIIACFIAWIGFGIQFFVDWRRHKDES